MLSARAAGLLSECVNSSTNAAPCIPMAAAPCTRGVSCAAVWLWVGCAVGCVNHVRRARTVHACVAGLFVRLAVVFALL